MYQVETISKKNPFKKVNEDLVGNYKNVFWLLDGASIPSNVNSLKEVSTSQFVRTIDEGIRLNLKLDESINLKDLITASVQYALNKLHKDIDNKSTEMVMPSSTIVMVRLLDQTIEYFILGDSYFILKNDYNILVEFDDRLKNIAVPIRRKIKNVLIEGKGYTSNELINLKKLLVEEENNNRNKVDGYWIISNNLQAIENGIYNSISIENTSNITLFLMSDGFARAFSTFRVFKSWDEFITYINEKGLSSCVDLVRRYEEMDPEGIKYPRTSKSDDASALVLTVTT